MSIYHPFKSLLYAALVCASVSLMVGDAFAMIQAKEGPTKKIEAFIPPKLDYVKICNAQTATPVSVNVKDERLDVKQKLRVAIELLNGGPNVFPNPVRAIRLLRQVMETKTPQAPRAKMQMARLYLLGQFIPQNQDKALELVKNIAPGDPYEAGYFLARLYQHTGEYAKAEQYYKRSALVGNPMAYLAMAYMYRDGLIADVSQERINQLATLAENRAFEELAQGNCKVAHDFGKFYLRDNLSPENHPAGIKWLEAAAAANNLSAISYLGQLYLYGIQVKQDVAKGLKYYEIGAKQNDAESIYRLGNYWLLKQKESAENRQKGAGYLDRAAKQGHQAAIKQLVRYYRGDFKDAPQSAKAVQLMERAITIPDINAEIPYMLAEAYELGIGAPKDEARAFKLYDRAAKLNFRDALVKLGDAYKFGIGVKRTPIKSYRFYRQAASVGSRDGMLALVENYQCGVGKAPNEKYREFWKHRAIHAGAGKVLRPEVKRLMLSKDTKDNLAGFMLLKRRVSDDDREAMVMLSHFYNQGIGTEQNRGFAQKWLQDSITHGDDRQKGYVALGEAYLDETMFGVDVLKAKEFFEKAMEIGSKDAGYELGKMFRDGHKGVPADIDAAIAAFRDAIARGNDNAMRKLAQLLIERKETAQAISLLERSAALHNLDSILELMDYYLRQSKSDKEALAKAIYWQKKAEAHYPCEPRERAKIERLITKLNGLDKTELPENAEEIKAQAEAGDVRAMRKMAQRLIYGTQNIEANPQEAFKWYLKAAQAGDAVAMLEIGNSYSTGLGVPPSKVKAREWWERAAKAGSSKAKLILTVDPSVVTNAPKKKPSDIKTGNIKTANAIARLICRRPQ